jgi:hypothetical protein
VLIDKTYSEKSDTLISQDESPSTFEDTDESAAYSGSDEIGSVDPHISELCLSTESGLIQRLGFDVTTL